VQDREKIIKKAEQEREGVIKESSQLKDQHAREREEILLNAEREKATLVAESYQKIEKESRKAHSKANLKVGLAFSAAVGVSGVMIFSQLVTVGVMFLLASGSGLSGYILRARQDRLSRKKQLALPEERVVNNE
jgi:F0F1-type ATP synthase membrane subunit b/b'